jgi:type II secretory pathway component GspD/PulD (secretin)
MPANGEGAPGAGQPQGVKKTELPGLKAPADIVITQTASGLIIASQDRQALDEFEQLLRSLLEEAANAPVEPTIFWLKYAKADVAAEVLKQILTGTSSSGAGGSLAGDVAQTVLGSVGGGIIGTMLGGGGGGSSALSGEASIVPDVRLNALVVQAPPAELRLIEQLLQVIDREAGPENVETGGKPRLIPVIYMPAQEMADIVKQVYADRVAGADANRQRAAPSPEDFIRALRGGRDGGRNQASGEVQKMTIGVDARSNSLIVAAPEPLFKDVEELVAQLDDKSIVTDESIQVIPLKKANPQLVQKALASLVGPSATSNINRNATSGGSQSTPGGMPGGGSMDDVQRRMEFFRSLRERMGGGGAPGGAPGGGFGMPGGGGPMGGGFGGMPGGGVPMGGGQMGGGGRGTSGGRTRGGNFGGRGGRGG